VTALARYPFSDKVVSVGEDQFVRLWSPAGRHCDKDVRLAAARRTPLASPRAVAVSPTGARLAVVCGREIYILDRGKPRPVCRLVTDMCIETAAWDGSRLSVAALNGCLARFGEITIPRGRAVSRQFPADWLTDRASSELLFSGNDAHHSGACVGPGFGFLFLGGKLVVRCPATGTKAEQLDLPGPIGAVAADTAKVLVAACGPGARHVCHVVFGRQESPHVYCSGLMPHVEPVSAAACDYRQRVFTTGDRAGRVVLWFTRAWDVVPDAVRTLDGHVGAVNALLFLPPDRAGVVRLVSAGEDGTIRRWEVDRPRDAAPPPAATRLIDL
jgi:WD40 repeat protein